MKHLNVCILILVSFSLLTSNAGVAEPTHPNEVGLYTTADGSGGTGTYVMGEPVDVYLVLTKPTDVNHGDQPFNVITGLELQLKFSPAPNNDLFLVNTELPPGSVDIGEIKDINTGILDFIVGIPDSEAVEVVDAAALLVRLTFLNFSSEVIKVSLGPTEGGWSIPGQMAFLGGMVPHTPYELLPMYSMGGSHEAPVFEFNGSAVAVESESFGSVKAMYR